MAKTSNLDLLRRLREAVTRAYALELADLDRQIKADTRLKPSSPTGGDHQAQLRPLLRVMQAAGAPLPPREIAARLDAPPQAVYRWLAAARRAGYVERLGGRLYRAAKEVPPL